jgi:hypothetical protein
MVIELVGPGAYYAAGISLPLVAWFILTHRHELRGTTEARKYKKHEMHKEIV